MTGKIEKEHCLLYLHVLGTGFFILFYFFIVFSNKIIFFLYQNPINSKPLTNSSTEGSVHALESQLLELYSLCQCAGVRRGHAF